MPGTFQYRLYPIKNQARSLESVLEMNVTRICNTCEIEKPLDQFHKDKNALGGHSRRCKVCAINHASTWQRDNQERVNKRNLEWKANHHAQVLVSNSRYRTENQEAIQQRMEKWRDDHREQRRAEARAYIRANKTKANANWHRRRARLMGATVEPVSREAVWERDKGICHICHKMCDPSQWHLDHIIPLSKGGEHSMANTAVSHAECNRKKGARL